jgi:hypothetical protein
MRLLIRLLRDNVKDVKISLFIWSNEANQTFNWLYKVFIKAFILRHFDSKQCIHIKIDVFNYTITSILF